MEDEDIGRAGHFRIGMSGFFKYETLRGSFDCQVREFPNTK